MLFFLANTAQKLSGKTVLAAAHNTCVASVCRGVDAKAGSFAVLTGVLKPQVSATTTTSAPIFIVPNATFIVELVIFIVVFGIIARFILPPIVKAMRDREEMLSSSMTGVSEAKTEAAKLLADAEGILAEARMTARQIIEEASNDAAEEANKVKNEALGEYAKEFAESQAKISASLKDLSRQLESQAEQLVIDIALGILPTGSVPISKEEAARAYSLAKVTRAGRS